MPLCREVQRKVECIRINLSLRRRGWWKKLHTRAPTLATTGHRASASRHVTKNRDPHFLPPLRTTTSQHNPPFRLPYVRYLTVRINVNDGRYPISSYSTGCTLSSQVFSFYKL